MNDAGRKIIEGLKEAISGNFSRITIGGQTWVRQERNRPLPTTRCDCCDNGLDDAWDFCPFCGHAHPDATDTKESNHGN